MKKTLRLFANFLIKLFVNFRLLLYRTLNYDKEKLFIYTDSRGFEITKIHNRKNPFSSYIKYLIKNYRCYVFTAPEKHTTIFDFIDVYEKYRRRHNFKHVIAHIGVVDFSPRPISQIENILLLKKNKIVKSFGQDLFYDILNFKGYDQEYQKEKTSAIAPEFLIPKVADVFSNIKNFVWISCNPVDINWRGNYPKDRPANINMVNDKSKALISLLKDVEIIDLTDWDLNLVHKYTCDNIHFNQLGMKFLEQEIIKIVKNEKNN